MKKIILSLAIVSLFVLPQSLSAQDSADCRKKFDLDMRNCTIDFNKCQASCTEKTKKPDGTAYINSGEIFSTCIKKSDCHGKNSACGNLALETYRTCVRSGKQPEGSDAKKTIPQQESNRAAQSINDWIEENQLEYNPDSMPLKPSQLKEEMFKKAQEAWKAEMVKAQAEFMIEPKFEFVWEGQWPNVKSAVFDTESGVVVASDSWKNIYLQTLADEITKQVVLQKGTTEIKVINEDTTKNKVSVQVGDFFDLFVIQTHFRVHYDPDKKTARVDVYEGEVSIKTKDGKTATIKPNGDKPGVLVITKKRKFIKLALVGGLAVVIVGVFFRQIRRMSDTQSHKKRPERLSS